MPRPKVPSEGKGPAVSQDEPGDTTDSMENLSAIMKKIEQRFKDLDRSFQGLGKDMNQRFDKGDHRLEALLQQGRSDGGCAYDDKEPGKLKVDSFTATSGKI